MKYKSLSVIKTAVRFSFYILIILAVSLVLEIILSLVNHTFPIITMDTSPVVSAAITLLLFGKIALALATRFWPEDTHSRIFTVVILLILLRPFIAMFIQPFYALLFYLFSFFSHQSFIAFFTLVFAVYLLYRILNDIKILKTP